MVAGFFWVAVLLAVVYLLFKGIDTIVEGLRAINAAVNRVAASVERIEEQLRQQSRSGNG